MKQEPTVHFYAYTRLWVERHSLMLSQAYFLRSLLFLLNKAIVQFIGLHGEVLHINIKIKTNGDRYRQIVWKPCRCVYSSYISQSQVRVSWQGFGQLVLSTLGLWVTGINMVGITWSGNNMGGITWSEKHGRNNMVGITWSE